MKRLIFVLTVFFLVGCEKEIPVSPTPIPLVLQDTEIILPPVCNCDLYYPSRAKCEDELTELVWIAAQWKAEACLVLVSTEIVDPDSDPDSDPEPNVRINLSCDESFTGDSFSCIRSPSDLTWDMSCDGRHDWLDMEVGSSYGGRGRVRVSRFDLQVSDATSSMQEGCRVWVGDEHADINPE